MSPQLVNRYKQLLASVPKGSFYSSTGQVVPHRDTPYELRVSTGVPNRQYGVFLNARFMGQTVTDANSIALLLLLLDLGDNEIKLVDSVTQEATLAYLTARDYAVWMAAEAGAIESIDEGVEQVLLDSRLATSSLGLIEDVFGQTVGTGNSFGYDLDTYRGLLQELRAAYRYWGGTVEGIARAVRAFTQVSPLIYPRSFGPRWILGKDFLSPKVNTAAATYYTTSPLTNINAGGANVSITSYSAQSGPGLGALYLYGTGSPKKLSWFPFGGPQGPQINITANGTYRLPASSYIDPLISQPGPFNIVAGRNDKLTFNLEERGIITVTLTAGAARTAAQIAADINAALLADLRYGALYGGAAGSYDPHASGTPMLALFSYVVNGGFIIYLNDLVDAAQTIFNLPDVRGGLSAGYVVGNTSIVLSAASNMNAWPLPSVDSPLRVVIGRTTFHPLGAPNAPATPTNTELVLVTNINRATRTLTLAAPGLAFNHNANEIAHPELVTPYQRKAVQDSREITVNVGNFTLLPASDVNDAVTVAGAGLPDGWVLTTNAGGAPTTTGWSPHVFFPTDRDKTFGVAVNHMFQIPVPDEILAHRGFPVHCAVWGRVEDPSYPATQTTISTIEASFDNRATWVAATGGMTTAGLMVNATWRPLEYNADFTIDPHTTKMWLRVKMTAGTNGPFIVHRVRLCPAVGLMDAAGLFLGDGTIPRNESKLKHGSFMYIWSPEDLTVHENESLGVAQETQVIPGHIDKLAPDMAWLDKFDVSTYDVDGLPLNVKGVFDETEFLAGTMTNLDIILRSPNRFTYLQPTRVSERTQTLDFSPITFKAVLDVEADQDQTYAVLFEGGVPVEQNKWQFNTALEVELLYTPLNKTYELRYQTLIQFESDVLDLGASWQDYLWFGDFHVFMRPHIEPKLVKITTGIQFDGEGVAKLPERSNQDQVGATLIEDTGVTQRIVPASKWSFLDAQRIGISVDVFEGAALYQLTYTAETNHPTEAATVVVEIRSATAAVNVPSADYEIIDHNHVVGSGFRYHQMRVTLSNIKDLSDAKVESLVLKGLGLFGVGLTTPVLRP